MSKPKALTHLTQPVTLKARRGAFLILKNHCRQTGVKQIDVMSSLIVENLHPAIIKGRRLSLWERVKRAIFPRVA